MAARVGAFFKGLVPGRTQAPAGPDPSKNLKNALTNYNRAIKKLRTNLGTNNAKFKANFNTIIAGPYAGNNSTNKDKALQNRVRNGVVKYARAVYNVNKVVATGATPAAAAGALNRAATSANNLSAILKEILKNETNPIEQARLYLSARKSRLANNRRLVVAGSNNAKILNTVNASLRAQSISTLQEAIKNATNNLNAANTAAIASRRNTLSNAISASGGKNKLNANIQSAVNNALKQLSIREQMIKYNSEQTPALIALGTSTNSNITKNAIVKILQKRKSNTTNAQTIANINAGIALVRPSTN